MKEGGYRTFGEYVWKELLEKNRLHNPEAKTYRFDTHIRNKEGEYTGTISRDALEKELKEILTKQSQFYPEELTENYNKKLLEIFSFQKPYITQELMEKMLGKCKYEPNEYRCYISDPLFEEFRIKSKLNDIKIKKLVDNCYKDVTLSKNIKQRLYSDIMNYLYDNNLNSGEEKTTIKNITFYHLREILNKLPIYEETSQEGLFWEIKDNQSTVAKVDIMKEINQKYQYSFNLVNYSLSKETFKELINEIDIKKEIDLSNLEISVEIINKNSKKILEFGDLKLERVKFDDPNSPFIKVYNKKLSTLNKKHSISIERIKKDIVKQLKDTGLENKNVIISIYNVPYNEIQISNKAESSTDIKSPTTIINILKIMQVSGINIDNIKNKMLTSNWLKMDTTTEILMDFFYKIVKTNLENIDFDELKDKYKQVIKELYNNKILDFDYIKTKEDNLIENLSNKLNLKSGTGNLSRKTLKNIMPYIETGLRVDEALVEAGYKLYQGSKSKKLPVMDSTEIRNPVVLRAVTQTRKIINAIVEKYGPPTFVHIELLRELGKSFEERKHIKNTNEDNKKNNENIKEELIRLFPNHFSKEKPPKGGDILKYKLWKEQAEFDIYTGKYISPENLLQNTEIDHIIPISISLDDSYNNKVLTFSESNQNKSQRTPYMFLDGLNDSSEWKAFIKRVKDSSLSNNKKNNLLSEVIVGDSKISDFTAAHLNNSKYISRYMKNYIENNLLFSDLSNIPELQNINRRVFVFNGRFTSIIRRYLGLNKNRDLNDFHHAIDATLIACSNSSYLQRTIEKFQQKELTYKTPNSTAKLKDNRFNIPEPWNGFKKEMILRTTLEKDEYLIEEFKKKQELYQLYNDLISQNKVRSVFPSRSTIKKANGALHEDTLLGFNPDINCSYKRISVKKNRKKGFKKNSK